ncbi:16S rRNA (guanine(966)-N(2))-methyltransferase RsmD [Endothiovibrio diazotrophicus]
MSRGRGGRAANQLRIIGGRWRGRKLAFPDLPGLRPTGDRVRETLFNWLAPIIEGSRCLDLFAGSGALGLEAASRGAARVVMVDRAVVVVRRLEAHRALLGAEAVEPLAMEAQAFLARPPEPFQVVFLDPPFGAGLLEPSCRALAAGGWLAPGAMVYLECERALGEPRLPEGWRLHRAKQAGEVAYFLAIAP